MDSIDPIARDPGPSEKVAHVLYIAGPLAIVALTVVLPLLRLLIRPASERSRYSGIGRTARATLTCVSPITCLSFIAQAILGSFQNQASSQDASSPDNSPLYLLASILIWGTLSVVLVESKSPHWPTYILAWTSGALIDASIVALTTSKELALSSGYEIARLSLHTLRITVLLAGAVCSLCTIERHHGQDETGTEEETSNLLGTTQNRQARENDLESMSYGSIPQVAEGENPEVEVEEDEAKEDEDVKEIKELQRKRLEEKGGWLGYLRSFIIFLPYLVPYNHRPTQGWVVVMILCMGTTRVLTLMIPRQLGILTESLGNMFGTGSVPWKDIAIWGLLQFPVSTITNMVENMATIRVSQYAYRRLTEAAFSHVMSLSMDYHTTKSTGRVTKAIEQGSNLSSVLNSVFNIAPVIIDFGVAVIYLTSYFDSTLGFIIIATAMIHAYVGYKGNGINMSYERVLSETYRRENETLYDSITNWQTVVYHNRATFEQDRYASSIASSLKAQRRYFDGFGFIHAFESFILDAGLLAAASVVALRVAAGSAKLSSFVFLVSYWSSIRAPMISLSWTLRETTSHLIDAEWLYQLLQTKPSVQEKPGARDLQWKGGRVDFCNVDFGYGPERPIIQDMTFTAEPGQSIALVGETGGGKSTTLKLLYRFYDVTGGRILIDGQDIRDVTLHSLRESLGAVPQEPSVFDQTIMENIIYARPGASEADVIEACKGARIHHQIMKFPDGYKTRLGERGVRLSGGELQRLSIARVLLRRPQIVVLDEATSSVDSDTEAAVQQAIRILSKDRTVFTVAHRLSTVVGADLILVIDGGKVVERGTHKELLELGGKYSRLWSMQTSAH
ncbi:unnamed protein product [Clonostachys rhizophaga]|uniref:Heavy metal tolerance protein n=1 Tax=Clonostachys rhizophaga TaxID=160324 RepID=A0A9N9VQW7_9HYPO|nr:unnamed protein product [Clonostachys rhizophaga]